jgi:hypothetical protein
MLPGWRSCWLTSAFQLRRLMIASAADGCKRRLAGSLTKLIARRTGSDKLVPARLMSGDLAEVVLRGSPLDLLDRVG